MRKWLFLVLLLPAFLQVSAQGVSKDPVPKVHADSSPMDKLMATATYPLIKGCKWSGVFPVKDITEKPDPSLQYKLLFEVTYRNPKNMVSEINQALAEVGRVINLHVAAGIPKENIIPVLIVHGPALSFLLKDDVFREKFKVSNPNIAFLQELEDAAGTHVIACGQAMAKQQVTPEDLLPGVHVALTAKTVLSSYQLKGYVLYSIHDVK